MTFAPSYLASERREKVGRQKLCSTPYQQEIDQECENLYSELQGLAHRPWIL
jgi:hypothetical protein